MGEMSKASRSYAAAGAKRDREMRAHQKAQKRKQKQAKKLGPIKFGQTPLRSS